MLRLLFPLLFVTVYSFAQKNQVSGYITDAENGEVLHGALIYDANNPEKGTSTNDYGFFSLYLESDTTKLVLQFIGYQQQMILFVTRKDSICNFKLRPESILTQEVLVQENKSLEYQNAGSLGVEVFDIKEIKKIPILLGEQDVLKTMQLMPGVKSIGEGSGGLYVRGGDNSQNLIILDEAIVYNAYHLLGFFSTFNGDAVKEATLYKGTAGASYGGRLSSVIDVQMKDGNNKKWGFGGGIGLIATRFYVEGPLKKDKASIFISGRRTYADLFLKLAKDSTIRNNQLYFYDLNMKANWMVHPKHKIFLSAYLGRDVFKFQDRFGIDWGNITGSLRWNQIVNSQCFGNTSLIYSNYDYQASVLRTGSSFSLQSVIENIQLKQDFHYFPQPNLEFEFGLQSIYHKIIPGQLNVTGDSIVKPVQLQKKYAWENALYASCKWKLNSFFNLEAGLRISSFSILGPGDFFSYDENLIVKDTTHYGVANFVVSYINPEPRINLSFVIHPQHTVKLSYTRNIQNLHLISNSTASSPTDIWLPSSKNVKPEIGDQISLGYHMTFYKDMFSLNLEMYYKSMLNQIDLKNGADIRSNELIEGELLSGIGRAYGIEFLLRKKTGKFTGWLSYTFSRTERQIQSINQGNWYPARQDATHDIALVLIYDINKRWTLSSTFVYRTGNAVTFPSGKYSLNGDTYFYYTDRNGHRMPDYHRLDFAVTYNFKKKKRWESSLSLSVYNLYGQKNPFSIEFKEDPNNPSQIQAVKTYLFTYVPSITYNFTF